MSDKQNGKRVDWRIRLLVLCATLAIVGITVWHYLDPLVGIVLAGAAVSMASCPKLAELATQVTLAPAARMTA
ncbi:MAG TPA: hypothetical protein VG055_28985 [Planctomycetaceae bacterium]|jgi:hypothetical protein|nr:hypothetical protein [Planctomycetaceae bacterium]